MAHMCNKPTATHTPNKQTHLMFWQCSFRQYNFRNTRTRTHTRRHPCTHSTVEHTRGSSAVCRMQTHVLLWQQSLAVILPSTLHNSCGQAARVAAAGQHSEMCNDSFGMQAQATAYVVHCMASKQTAKHTAAPCPQQLLTLIVSLYCPVWSALGEKYLTQHDTELAAALPVMSYMHTCMLKTCCACSPHSIASSLAALHAAVAVQLQKKTSPGHTLCHSRIITNTSSNTSAVKLVKITTPQATLLQYN